MTAQDREKDSSEVRWLFVLTAVLLMRLGWVPSLLSTDTVNLAYALESFDPRQHQPQPPGYPFFVAFAKLVRWFAPSTEVAFWLISVIVTAVSAVVLYLLAKRMTSSWAGMAAVILFVLNPVFWFSRLHSPLRPWLALFSLLVAYCAWRAWNGERRFAWYGAVALGVGSGFRPDLLPYLFPLWAASAWMATRSWKPILQGGLLIAGVSAVWFVAVVDAMGGIGSTLHTMSAYTQEQSRRDSLVFAESVRLWLRPVSRLITWNALALAGWIWVPIVGYRRLAAKTVPWKFLLAWAVPGLAFQMFFHIAAPGHTLFATPVLCLLGASLMSMMGRYRNAALAVAAIVNAGLFGNALPLGYPAPADSPFLEKAWISARNSIAFGTFETSQDRLRWWEEATDVSMKELREFTPADRPTVVIALNGTDTEFDFVNWRVVSYYMDQQPLWILSDHLPAGQFGRVRRAIGRNVQLEPGSTISLPRGGRVLWIMMPDGTFDRALKRVLPVHRGRYIAYSEIGDGLEPFEIDGFLFQPESALVMGVHTEGSR